MVVVDDMLPFHGGDAWCGVLQLLDEASVGAENVTIMVVGRVSGSPWPGTVAPTWVWQKLIFKAFWSLAVLRKERERFQNLVFVIGIPRDNTKRIPGNFDGK